jgi:hypothetical protein
MKGSCSRSKSTFPLRKNLKQDYQGLKDGVAMNIKDTNFLLLRILVDFFLKNENYQNSNMIHNQKDFDIYQIVEPMLSINWTFIMNKYTVSEERRKQPISPPLLDLCYFSLLVLFSSLKGETESGVEHLRNN